MAVEGTDGTTKTVDLLVEETTSAASAAYLAIDVSSCKGRRCTEVSYGKALDAAEFEISSSQTGTTAVLDTTFAGDEVHVVWTLSGASQSTAVGAGRVATGIGGDANVSASLLGFGCNVMGELYDVVGVEPDRAAPSTAGEPKKRPAGFAGASCA